MFGLTPIIPAYGRDYASAKAAQADFDANKDFRAANGRYCSKADIIELGIKRPVECRSADLRKVWMLKVV